MLYCCWTRAAAAATRARTAPRPAASGQWGRAAARSERSP